MSCLPLPLLLLLPCATPAPRHAQAVVNDPRSHGVLGDAWLSLDEAIRLHNRDLIVDQLSAAERNQILGSGDIFAIKIDALAVPTLRLEGELTPIADSQHGLFVEGFNGRPVLDLTGRLGIRCDSGWAGFRNLELRGGRRGVDVVQPAGYLGIQLEDMVCSGQSEAALAIAHPEGGAARVLVQNCVLRDVPTGLLLDQTGAGRTGPIWIAGLEVERAQHGLLCTLGPGGSLELSLERTTLRGCRVPVHCQRGSPAADRPLLLAALHLAVAGGDFGVVVDGHPQALTTWTLQACDLAADAAEGALAIRPVDTPLQLSMADCRIGGGLTLGSRGGSLQLGNVLATGGRWLLGAEPGPLALTDSRLENVALQTAGQSPLVATNVALLAGAVTGTPAAPVHLQDSHVSLATQVGSHVASTNPLPGVQLGSCGGSARGLRPGAWLDLDATLPAGRSGHWMLGLTGAFPITVPPFRLYADPGRLVVLPQTVRGASRERLTVPPDPGLLGLDFYAQLLVTSDSGQPGPYLSLPPGWRFVIR